MLTIRRFRILSLPIIVVALAFAAPSASASVAYIDGNEVWVASDDGARKVRLSAGEGDWREVAQSDQGFIVGTRKETGKISQLASFTVWDPSGKVVRFGALSGHQNEGGLNVYPTSLDITPSGGNIVYGYQRVAGYYPNTSLVYGTYMKLTADATTAVPLSLSGWKDGTLFGNRVVAHPNDTEVWVQDASSIASEDFAGWINFGPAIGDPANPYYNLIVDRTDVAATGAVAATELRDDSFYTQKIALSKWAGPVSTTYVDDCVLPTAGLPSNISLSQDANTITWRDDRGIVIAGAPDFSGPATCNLTRAPAVIAPGGVWPSYGPFDVAAAAGGGTTAGAPTVKVPSSTKLATFLKKGLTITVTSATAGTATAKLTIKPKLVGKRGKKLITLATGKVKVSANKATKLKLKFSKSGKKLKKKLKGKKATLTVTVGGVSTTKSLKLK